MELLIFCLIIAAAGLSFLIAPIIFKLPAFFDRWVYRTFVGEPVPTRIEAEAVKRQQALVAEMRDILAITEDALQHCSTRIKQVEREISLQERKERVARRRPLQRRLGRV